MQHNKTRDGESEQKREAIAMAYDARDGTHVADLFEEPIVIELGESTFWDVERLDGGRMVADGGVREGYEVVIRSSDGLDEDHAESLRKRLIGDGFHSDAVSIRPVDDGGDRDV